MNYAMHSDVELLSLIIGLKEAQRLYAGKLTPLFWSPHGGGRALAKLGAARELVKRSLAEELQRVCVLTTPYATRDYIRTLVAGLEYECFVALFLDNRNRLIASEELSRGTIDGASIYPREIVKRALAHNAAAVIFAHNHPSGSAEPSAADRDITARLKSALGTIDIRILDHVVIGGPDAVSLAERGWI
jgi:DNA repair protein RadC